MKSKKIKELILEARSNYSIPQYSFLRNNNNSNTNNKSYLDFDILKLTFSQRMTCFLIFFGVGILFFLYSLTRLFGAIFSPKKFIVPYVFSNLMFFTMMGFIYGFKNYFNSLFTNRRRKYTSTFLGTTLFTIFCVYYIKSYFINIILVIIQIVSFCCFAITFLPLGAQTLDRLLKNFIKI